MPVQGDQVRNYHGTFPQCVSQVHRRSRFVWVLVQNFTSAEQLRTTIKHIPSTAHQPAQLLPGKLTAQRGTGKSPESSTHMLSFVGRTFSSSSLLLLCRNPYPWTEGREMRDCQLYSCAHWLLITGEYKWSPDMPHRKDHAQSSMFPLYHTVMKSLTLMRHPAEKGVSI